MLIDAPPTLLNTIMHNKHLSHLVAKSMNELAHKSPLIPYAKCKSELGSILGRLPFVRTDRPGRTGSHWSKWKATGQFA